MDNFAYRLLNWFDQHGRQTLPWQGNRSLYRVWVSEIMLQQTQVGTVIPYYRRFIARFKGVRMLADASLDEVLSYWSGLGYYSRARSLHQAARQIRDTHRGRFPQTLEQVMALPGIGRSTAGAILTLAGGQRHPILDGNVKRVLARFHGIEGWSGEREVEAKLWQLAEEHTPTTHVSDYTQAIMDLGALVCRRGKPSCTDCPQQRDCVAHAEGRQDELPTPRPARKLPTRQATLWVLTDRQGRLLLQRRPPAGIWGGLWSLPEAADHFAPQVTGTELTPLRHTFSHFHLHIQPLRATLSDDQILNVADRADLVWHPPERITSLGLPAPIRRILNAELGLTSRLSKC